MAVGNIGRAEVARNFDIIHGMLNEADEILAGILAGRNSLQACVGSEKGVASLQRGSSANLRGLRLRRRLV